MSNPFFGWSSEGDLLDAAPDIATALDVPRSIARKMIAQDQVQGTCSQCGEARYSDYTCRDGGATVWVAK